MTVPKQFQQLSERVAICLGNPPETAESALAFTEHFDGFRQGSQLEEGMQVLACIACLLAGVCLQGLGVLLAGACLQGLSVLLAGDCLHCLFVCLQVLACRA